MKLSIVILNYYSRYLIEFAIKRLKETIRTTTYEIIVVDNGTYDGTKEMLNELYPEVIFVQTGKNLGYSAGNNAGVAVAQGDYVMIMNPDIFVQPHAVDDLVSYISQHNDIGLLAPQLINGDGSVQMSIRTFQTLMTVIYRRTPLGLTTFGKQHLKKFLMEEVDHSSIMDVDWALGACHLFPKKFFDELDGYDPRFQLYVEDMDMCRRVWIAGKRVVYYPHAQMIHLHAQASASSPWAFMKIFTNKLTRWHIVSFLKYMKKFWNNNNYGARSITAK
ncbi:glycosyltransferase family 2 protein [Candidatus Falkowbacteria bacterium]|nr:glycosyltransferase family 2 protein [Candidatus Falkowbacteria bacterium]